MANRSGFQSRINQAVTNFSPRQLKGRVFRANAVCRSTSVRREYPEAPIIGVGAVVIDGSKVLLVRRGQEPLKGEWSLPGGALELGETLAAGRGSGGAGGDRPDRSPGRHCRSPRPDYAGRGLGAGSLPLRAGRFSMPRGRRHAAAAAATRKRRAGWSERNCRNRVIIGWRH